MVSNVEEARYETVSDNKSIDTHQHEIPVDSVDPSTSVALSVCQRSLKKGVV